MARFRLQQVLELRRRREDEQQQRLAAAALARVQAEERLRAMIATQQRRREALACMLDGGRVDAARVQDMGLLVDAAAHAVTARREEVARAAAFEQEERDRLTVAMSQRKALDRLREHHEAGERRERDHQEALLLDEITTARAAHGRHDGHEDGRVRSPLPCKGRGPGG